MHDPSISEFSIFVDKVRLDRYLAATLQGDAATATPSRAALQALIEAGHVTVDGEAVKAKQMVRRGQVLRLRVPPPVPSTLTPVAMDLDVLYEDAHLLVLNKPAHLAVHPGAGIRTATLVHGLLAHCSDLSGIGGVQRPGIVHRLDANTTGTLVVAKHDTAHRHLAHQFAERTVDKHYLALVHASQALAAGEGRIDTPYGRHVSHRHRFSGQHLAASSRPRRAITSWRLGTMGPLPGLPSEAGPLAVVLCRLLTGRTHQLRVHLAELGCPIVGDALYGGRRCQSFAAMAARVPALAGLDHQALHAWRLAFDHPINGERLTFTAPLPPSWGEAAQSLRKAAPQSVASTLPKEAPCA